LDTIVVIIRMTGAVTPYATHQGILVRVPTRQSTTQKALQVGEWGHVDCVDQVVR